VSKHYIASMLTERYITQDGKRIRAFPLYELKRRMKRRELSDADLAKFAQVTARRDTITGGKRWALVVTQKQ